MNRFSLDVLRRGLFSALFAGIYFLNAASTLGRPIQQSASPKVCPLSDSQTQKAIEIFANVAGVFKNEPRCVNCHGAVNPFAPNTIHAGGRYDPVFNSQGKLDVDTMINKLCADCHRTPWLIPNPDDLFTNKDTLGLCKHMKDAFGNDAEAFLLHMKDDRFAQIGFEGTRGLTAEGQAFYEAATGQPYKPEPPRTITHEGLVQLAQNWVQAMGGKFKGDAECGCKPLRYALEVKIHDMIEITAGPAKSSAEVKEEFRVPMAFDDNEKFESEEKHERNYKGTTTGAGVTCETTANIPITWKISGSIDDEKGMIHLKADWATSATTGTTRCVAGAAAIPPASFQLPGADSKNFSVPLSEFDLRAFVGESKSFTLKMTPFSTSEVTVTIVKTD